MSERELALLKFELAEFDAKVKDLLGLPINLKRWRMKRMKMIEREEMKIIRNYFKEPKKSKPTVE